MITSYNNFYEFGTDKADPADTLGIDDDAERIECEVEPIEGDDTFVMSLSKEQAGGLAIAISRLIDAGRPPCPLCALPLDPRGHDCPRTNGYRAPLQ